MKNALERNIDFFDIFSQLHEKMYKTRRVLTQSEDFFFLTSPEKIWGVPINITLPALQEIVPELKEQIIVLGDNVALLSESVQFVWCSKAEKFQDKELQGFYCFNEEAYLRKRSDHFRVHQVNQEKTDPNLLRWHEQSLIFLLTATILRGEISAKNDFHDLLKIGDYRAYLIDICPKSAILEKEMADVERQVGSLSAIQADKYIAGLIAQLIFMGNNRRKESTHILIDRVVSAIKDIV